MPEHRGQHAFLFAAQADAGARFDRGGFGGGRRGARRGAPAEAQAFGVGLDVADAQAGAGGGHVRRLQAVFGEQQAGPCRGGGKVAGAGGAGGGFRFGDRSVRRLADPEKHRAHPEYLFHFALDGEDETGGGGFHIDHGLVGLHLGDDLALFDAGADGDVETDELDLVVVVIHPRDINTAPIGKSVSIRTIRGTVCRTMTFSSISCWARSRLRAAAMGTGGRPRRTTVPR